MAHLFPVAPPPSPHHCRWQVRHPGEHCGPGGGRRPRVCGAAREWQQAGLLPEGDFRYDPARDVYSCPAGKLLRPLGKRNGVDRYGKVTFYRARASECAVCQLRPQCTSNKNGRQLRRDPKERYAERVRAYRGTALYEKALRKRKVWVEPLFAEAKDWHGMRRFRLRRLEKVNIEALLIASGQNAKRLLDFGGWRPKKLAQAAALLLPVAAGHESSRAREHRSSRSWRLTKAFFNSLGRFWYNHLRRRVVQGIGA